MAFDLHLFLLTPPFPAALRPSHFLQKFCLISDFLLQRLIFTMGDQPTRDPVAYEPVSAQSSPGVSGSQQSDINNSQPSGWDGSSHRVDLHKDDADYGTPVEGSLTDKRGRKAGTEISNEVIELCRYIHDLGHRLPGPQWAVHFGILFDFYTKISNKLVGMLMRARKHGLVKFEGEMLYQRRDDLVVIYLVSIPVALREYVAQKDGLPLEIIP